MHRRGLDVLYDQAESQGGYFTTRQAGEAGISTRLLTYYTKSADIERVAHGVYRVARFPMHRFGNEIAATLWVGPGSAVSHDSALAVYGLGGAMPAIVHVSVARAFRGSRDGVVVHTAPLPAEQTTVWDDVPVVSVARALVDVATDVDPSLARDAADEAIRRGLTTPDRIVAYLNGKSDADHLTRLLLPATEQTSTS